MIVYRKISTSMEAILGKGSENDAGVVTIDFAIDERTLAIKLGDAIITSNYAGGWPVSIRSLIDKAGLSINVLDIVLADPEVRALVIARNKE